MALNPGPDQGANCPTELSVVSPNCRGSKDSRKAVKYISSIKKQNSGTRANNSINFLQECHEISLGRTTRMLVIAANGSRNST